MSLMLGGKVPLGSWCQFHKDNIDNEDMHEHEHNDDHGHYQRKNYLIILIVSVVVVLGVYVT